MSDDQKLFNDVVVAVFAKLYDGTNLKGATLEAHEVAERFMRARRALGYDKKLDPYN